MDDVELSLTSPAGSARRRRRRSLPPGMPPKPETPDLWHYEAHARAAGYAVVVGVDEAGRGPLAGPVTASAVILPAGFDIDGINDSKKLSEAQRERAFERIQSEALGIGIGMSEPDEIDSINILKASWAAMRRAILDLAPETTPDLVLVDGLAVTGLPCPVSWPIVGGDGASASIAAASIVAKVTRDRLMVRYDSLYPEYGFAQHKGYGASKHLEALRCLGPCPIHRRSFAPVANCLGGLFDE